jgi:hypothetical protein
VLPSRSFLEAHFKRSLDRSRARRGASEAARSEARRRRLTRLPAPTVAVVLALSVAGVGGLGAATAHFNQQNASAPSSGVLTVGSRGPGVAALQSALGVGATGYYGSVTRRAVLRFQRSRGLLVDGVAGPQTLGALGLSPASNRTGSGDGSASGSGSGAASGATQDAPTQAQTGAGSGPLQAIASCESGGNPAAVGGRGRYRGKYQFTIDTWRAYGGTGDPANASEAVQDAIAAKVLAAQGPSAWPSCAR